MRPLDFDAAVPGLDLIISKFYTFNLAPPFLNLTDKFIPARGMDKFATGNPPCMPESNGRNMEKHSDGTSPWLDRECKGRELERGENCRILEYLQIGVAKWLNSATWNAAHTFPFDRFTRKSEPRCVVTNHAEKSLGA